MDELLVVSAPPHIHSNLSTNRAVYAVCLGLVPSMVFGILNFGTYAFLIVFLSVISSTTSEAVFEYLAGKKITISDGTAILTGLLLAMSLPPGVPLWVPIIGSGFAIILVKQVFGGLGFNYLNPALAARAFLTLSFPQIMNTAWRTPSYGSFSGIDTISQATPLTILKNPAYYGNTETIINRFNSPDFLRTLFSGMIGGSIGETCKIALIIGGLALLFLKIIDYRIVSGYIVGFLLLNFVMPNSINPIFQLFTGGVLIAIFFMATDWVTTPITKNGRWIFGVGCGILTTIFRHYSHYPEGVTPAILLMNLITPLIDKLTNRRLWQPKIK
ncbi:MAG: RnfABCDGE type electron transport complex subunit D [bacterium]